MPEFGLIILLFFIVAVLYSSVGFGGGSSYIAILLVFGMAVEEVRMTALLCNIIVVSGAIINFQRHNLIKWKKVIPLVILSVPFAFIGGSIKPHHSTYLIVASFTLILAAIAMFFQDKFSKKSMNFNRPSLLGIGGGIGVVSGFIGIGGGIFLSPILHLTQWDNAKVISATASFFIFVNSIAGLIGQLTTGLIIDLKTILLLGGSVLIGGQIGNRLNIKTLDPKTIRIGTAILVGLVGLKLLKDGFN